MMVGGASGTEHILWKKRNTSRREKAGQQHNESRMNNNERIMRLDTEMGRISPSPRQESLWVISLVLDS